MFSVGVQPKMENGALNWRIRCSCLYNSVPPATGQKCKNGKEEHEADNEKESAAHLIPRTPEVNTTIRAITKKGSRKRTSQKASVETRKQR